MLDLGRVFDDSHAGIWIFIRSVDGKTGAPGEGTCHDCHATYPLNSGNGTFSISGPTTFEPGQTYQISVHIPDPGQLRWGFEFTSLNYGTIQITDAVHT